MLGNLWENINLLKLGNLWAIHRTSIVLLFSELLEVNNIIHYVAIIIRPVNS